MLRSWRFIGLVSVLAAVFAVSSGDLFAQKKNKGKQDPGYPATDEDYTQIKNTKELSGTLLTIDGSNLIMTIRVEVPHQEPNPKYKPKAPKLPKAGTPGYQQAKLQYDQYRLYQDIVRQQQILQTAKTPQQRQNAMLKLQLDMYKYQSQQTQAMVKSSLPGALPGGDPNNQPFITVTTTKDYTLDIKDKVIVRKMFLPMEYDDMGNVKKYTDKEKEELKGKDKKLPGYEAKLDELVPTQEIKITLTPPKAKKKDDKKADDKKKDSKDAKEAKDAKDTDSKAAADPKAAKDADSKDAKADKDTKTGDAASTPPEPSYPERPTVTMIVMTKELPVASVEPANPKKKKKNN